MGELNFQTGKKSYIVNGGAEIHFDPADINFVNRLFNMIGKLEKLQNEGAAVEEKDIFTVAARRDAEIRSWIDAVFEEPVCDKVFGTTNVYSPVEGIPVCIRFLMSVIDEVDAESAQATKVSPQMAAYMQKYEKKYGKHVKK